jgi:hypothetical protein
LIKLWPEKEKKNLSYNRGDISTEPMDSERIIAKIINNFKPINSTPQRKVP